MARSFAFPQEGGDITGDRATGIAGIAVGITCLTISAALVTAVVETPRAYAALAFLGVSIVAFVVLMARRRPTAAAPPSIVEPDAAADPRDLSALLDDEILRFTRDVTRPASFDQVQMLIAQQLPLLLGVDRAWIVARL